MKKLIIASCMVAGILVACGKKMTPASTPTGTESKTSASTEKTADEKEQEAKQAEQAKTSTDAAPAIKVSPEEAGKSLYSGKCTKCHASKNVANYTPGQWEGILQKMVPYARLTAEEENQLRVYIKANAKQ